MSVVAASPPIRRSLSPLDETLLSVGPPSSRAYMEAALQELWAVRQDLAEAREEVKRLKQVEQKEAVCPSR